VDSGFRELAVQGYFAVSGYVFWECTKTLNVTVAYVVKLIEGVDRQYIRTGDFFPPSLVI